MYSVWIRRIHFVFSQHFQWSSLAKSSPARFRKSPAKTVDFGVSSKFETSVSHVSDGESEDSIHREAVARQRKRRFCDQCYRVDVKEQSTEQY